MKLQEILIIILFLVGMAGLIWLLNRRYQIRNPWIRWLAILAPSLVLLPYFWISIERSTVTHWLIADVIFVGSICSGLVGLFRLLFDIYDWQRWQRLAGPILSIIVFLLAHAYVEKAPAYAEDIGRSIAHALQKQSENQQICPQTVPGWETFGLDTNREYTVRFYVAARTMAGKGPLKFPLIYLRSFDGREFILIICHTKNYPLLKMTEKDHRRFLEAIFHPQFSNDITCRGKYRLFVFLHGRVDRQLTERGSLQ